MMEAKDFPMGLTVKELKEIIKDWPEVDAYGELTEVWIETGHNLSSPVMVVSPLNHRIDDGIEWADIILESSAFDDVK